MEKLMVIGFLLGIDNFKVAATLEMMSTRYCRKGLMILAFGVFETLMPLLGIFLGGWFQERFAAFAAWIALVALAISGVLILMAILRNRWQEKQMQHAWFWLGMPLCLSFDNLFAGVALQSLNFPVWGSALFVGVLSSLICFLGVVSGRWLREKIPLPLGVVGATGLLLFALISILF